MKKLTLYYPEIISLDETFIKAVSLEVWVQSPNTQLWHCAVMKHAWGNNYEARILGNKTCIPEPGEPLIEYFSSWEKFFNKDKENANHYPNGHNLWTILLEGSTEPVKYGYQYLEPKDIQTLKMLNQQCQGWWYWDEQQDKGTIFVRQRLQSYFKE